MDQEEPHSEMIMSQDLGIQVWCHGLKRLGMSDITKYMLSVRSSQISVTGKCTVNTLYYLFTVVPFPLLSCFPIGDLYVPDTLTLPMTLNFANYFVRVNGIWADMS